VDLFFASPLKSANDRSSLYKNLGGFQFQRVPLLEIAEKTKNIKKYGMPTNAVFVDTDGDGDKDLFITYAFGSPILLQNQLIPTGSAQFKDVTKESGLDHYTVSVSADFADYNGDGIIDLFIANAIARFLPDYETPTRFNLFKLPLAKYPGDKRMFHFMHESWNMANNGGFNDLYLGTPNGKFIKQDAKKWNIEETRWSLAVGSADFNHDGWIDIYVANDFGPDDLYLNDKGTKFINHKGDFFGTIGKDTYKGMNVSIADLDRNGYMDVYVSNVHHPLQAEGSLLWMFDVGTSSFFPDITDRATELGVLNEHRFGWGASLVDFNNDGWIDIAQANGMVDDSQDQRFEKCPDYWYINEKIARSPPSIHAYANNWGDVRGSCIHHNERNRIYLNRGVDSNPQFVDVAGETGLTQTGTFRGMSAADLNNDGAMDLVVTSVFQSPLVFKNESLNHWIGLELKSQSPCPATGAVVTIEGHGGIKTFFHQTQISTGFSAQNDPRVHFGLGEYSGSLTVSVLWCEAHHQQFDIHSVDRYHTLNMDNMQ